MPEWMRTYERLLFLAHLSCRMVGLSKSCSIHQWTEYHTTCRKHLISQEVIGTRHKFLELSEEHNIYGVLVVSSIDITKSCSIHQWTEYHTTCRKHLISQEVQSIASSGSGSRQNCLQHNMKSLFILFYLLLAHTISILGPGACAPMTESGCHFTRTWHALHACGQERVMVCNGRKLKVW